MPLTMPRRVSSSFCALRMWAGWPSMLSWRTERCWWSRTQATSVMIKVVPPSELAIRLQPLAGLARSDDSLVAGVGGAVRPLARRHRRGRHGRPRVEDDPAVPLDEPRPQHEIRVRVEVLVAVLGQDVHALGHGPLRVEDPDVGHLAA